MHKHAKNREVRAAWLFLSPNLMGLSIFVLLPIILALILAFFRTTGFGDFEFAALRNFSRMVGDPLLPSALRVTIVYAGLFVPLTYIAGLSTALLLQRSFPGVGVVRTALFIPYVLSLVVVAIIWQFLVVDKTGVVPKILRIVNLDHISWLGDPKFALITLVIISIWSQVGYQMLLLLGGLNDIPREYYDAAEIDGVGRWSRLRQITLPLLKPTSFFVLLTAALNAITGLQAFDLVYVVTKGGPSNSTTTMPFYIYEQAFTYNDLGYASALTLLLVAALLVVVLFVFKATKGARFQ